MANISSGANEERKTEKMVLMNPLGPLQTKNQYLKMGFRQLSVQPSSQIITILQRACKVHTIWRSRRSRCCLAWTRRWRRPLDVHRRWSPNWIVAGSLRSLHYEKRNSLGYKRKCLSVERHWFARFVDRIFIWKLLTKKKLNLTKKMPLVCQPRGGKANFVLHFSLLRSVKFCRSVRPLISTS